MRKSGVVAEIIKAVSAPLGFYVLALLIVEGFLSMAVFGADVDCYLRIIGMCLGAGLFSLVSVLVFRLVWHKPTNLVFDKAAHIETASNEAVYADVNRPRGKKPMGYNKRAFKKVERSRPSVTYEYAAVSHRSETREVFLVVDVQNDFFADGSLAVSEAETLIEPLNKALHTAEDAGLLIVFTQDWHSIKHCSFQENGGDWPPHCIMKTAGAAIHSEVYKPKGAKYVPFGVEPDLYGYSPFENPLMYELVNTGNVSRVYVAGIALEYCVYETCKELRQQNIEVIAVKSLIRAADSKSAKKAWNNLEALDVKQEQNLDIVA